MGDGAHSDGNSSSCDLLDILLQEDSHSGTGSATSGSMGSRYGSGSGSRSGSGSGSRSGSGSGSRSGSGSGSGCNGCGTSGSGGSGSRTGSSHTSKYFGSIDSLEHDPKAKVKPRTRSKGGSDGAMLSGPGEDEHFDKSVLQEPLWLLRANADDKVMMTYQLPSRDIQKVLREDKERLRQMQKSQPHFSSDQRRELLEEHPWMRRGGLPAAINVKECVYCQDAAGPIEEDLSHMDMGEQTGVGLRPDGQNSHSKELQPRPDTGS